MAGGADEVAQLRSGQELMTEIMMTFDVRVPQQASRIFVRNEINRQSGPDPSLAGRRAQHRPLDVRMSPIRDGFDFSRRRQSEQPIGLHPQQGHPTTHILEAAVGAPPVQALADFQREPIAAEGRGYREQLANELDLRSSQSDVHSTAWFNSSESGHGSVCRRAVFPRLRTDSLPTAPQDGEPRAPRRSCAQVAAEAADHAHRFTQRRGLGCARMDFLKRKCSASISSAENTSWLATRAARAPSK